MKEIIQQLIANRLQDFAGLSIKGSIPVSERLANEVLQQMVQKMKEAPSPQSGGVNPSELLEALAVEQLHISFQAGKMIVEFEVTR